MKEKLQVSILRTVGAYTVFSLLWIFLTDQFVFSISKDIDTLVNWQTIKGVIFVLSSAIFLFVLLWNETKQREKSWLAYQEERENLIAQLKASNDKLTDAWDATIKGWSQTIELRDADTRHHSDRGIELTVAIAKKMGIQDPVELQHLRWGALLHDIGKIGIPDSILKKPGRLTPQEREIVNQHPVLAAELLEGVEYLKSVTDIPLYHHERWDGSGYPHGLKGEEIPLTARVFSVVDVWDAMTSDRPYRDAISQFDAINYISEQSGKHFDPQVVLIFLKLINESNSQDTP